MPRVANNFGYREDQVKTVHHPIDVCEYLGFHELTTRMVERYRLLDADAIIVYPVRLDRGKQVQFCVRVASQLKRINRSVRLVVVDFHSTGGDKVVYRRELRNLGTDLGLNENEMVFTSEFAPETRVSCPRQVVRDLMLLCNVYIHPSVSETYSLTTQEAGLCGAFLVLNQDFPPMRSVYGPYASYWQFSGAIHFSGREDGEIKTEYVDIMDYCYAIAQRIAYELDNNLVLAQQRQIRKTRNLDYIFRTQLEPLLYARD